MNPEVIEGDGAPCASDGQSPKKDAEERRGGILNVLSVCGGNGWAPGRKGASKFVEIGFGRGKVGL